MEDKKNGLLIVACIMSLVLFFYNFPTQAFEGSAKAHNLYDLMIKALESKENVYEFQLKSKNLIFEKQKKSQKRLYKNQQALAKLLQDSANKIIFDNLLNQGLVDNIRIVYCNSYAVFIMSNGEVLHTFLIDLTNEKMIATNYSR